jgi:tripartite-type tricarboxylate transporter receptor subunit TctC
VAAAACATDAPWRDASAQSFPERPIRLVVPFSPGGAADSAARIVAKGMSEVLAQPVVVDNRPGAGGILGTEAVANAAPDGHTLLWVNSNHVINPNLYKKLPYDTSRSFSPVALVATTAFVLVVHPSLQATSVRELVHLAKARPGELNYASLGNGSGAHFAAEFFKVKTGIDMVQVPYKGIARAVPDLLAGSVSVMFPNVANARAHVRAGRLRALAITTLARSPLLPELPTMEESGIADYEFKNWLGILAPARTPPRSILALSRSVQQLAASKPVQQAFANDGATLVASTPAAFGELLAGELERYAALSLRIGLKPD